MKKLELLGPVICLYVHIDAKKLSMSDLVSFSKALRDAILLREDTLNVL